VKFSRDFGAVAWGGFYDDKLKYYAGIFQGRQGITRTTHPFSGATVTSSIDPGSSFEAVVERRLLAWLRPLGHVWDG